MRILKNAVGYFSKNKAQIWNVAGCAGVYLTAILAAQGSLRAVEAIQDSEWEKGELTTKKEKIKIGWKYYLPAFAASLGTIFCITKSKGIYEQRIGSLLSLYSLSESVFKDYQDKTKEMLGNGKETKIKDGAMAGRILRRPMSMVEIADTGFGDFLCYDLPSDRYFRSDAETIKQIEQIFNRKLEVEELLTLNELYYEFKLPPTHMGDDFGWLQEDHSLNIIFSTHVTEEGEPCLVLDYKIFPLFKHGS